MSEHEILFSCSIPGRAGIKKNSKRIVFNKKTGRRFPISSAKYMSWENLAALIIKRQKSRDPIDFPVNVKMLFYLKNHQHEADLSNLYQGIEDVLQDCEVITNDKLINGHDGSRKIFGASEERVEIVITKLEEMP